MQTSNPLKNRKLAIEIQYASPAIESALIDIAPVTLIKKWVKTSTSKSGMLTVRFVNAAEGKKLNAGFRNKNYATNVLTFTYEVTPTSFNADLVLCLPVLKKEAKTQKKPLQDHLAHLIIHGCLHAQGHDHEIEKDAKKMESLEVALLKKLGIANPYLAQ